MEAIKHANCNTVAVGEGCFDLPVEVTTEQFQDGEVPCFRSYWKPSEEELEALSNGGCIVLSQLTDTIPPVILFVTE